MAFDDEDDYSTDTFADDAATDFSDQARRAPPGLDFSAFADPVTARPAQRRRGPALDFSNFADPVTVPSKPPLPRSRPASANQSAEPVEAPPQPSTAAEVPLPRPRPDIGNPADADYVAPLEDAPFRSGGTALDKMLGPDAGMLSGEEAYKAQQDRIRAAEADLASAKAEREAAQARFDEFGKDPSAAVTADRRLLRRALTLAQRRETVAEETLGAARRAPAPTQTWNRNAAETITSGLAQAANTIAKNIQGLDEGSAGYLDIIDPALAEKRRAGNKEFVQNLDEGASQFGVGDPARKDDLSTKLISNATSMATFMAGGFAARALGAAPALGAGGLGAMQMGGQMFGEAEQAIRSLDRQIETARASGQDPAPLEAKRDTLLKTKYLALFAGMGLGATEAIPVERFFHSLNQVSKGRVAAILANATTQGMEETLQEIGQQIGQNTVAKVLYDEGRDIFQGVNDSAGVAMVLGALMGAGAGAVQPRALPQIDVQQPPVEPVPGPGESPIEQIFRRAAETVGQQQPGAPVGSPKPAETTVPPDQAGEPQAPPNVTAIERRILRKKGWAEEDIDGMSRAEVETELGEAAQQGVVSDEEKPSAEPVSDIMAQVEDMKVGKRDGVWLPKATVEHLRSIGTLDTLSGTGTVLKDFDGEGGMLIARDRAIARQARKDRTSGVDMQEIVGRITGAGVGKPPGADTVVQQQDRQGNVTRESLVADEDVVPVARDFAEPGRNVEVMPSTDALAKRAARVNAEAPDFSAQAVPADGSGTKDSPARINDPLDLARAEANVSPDPTPAQKEAENFRMAHVRWPGLGREISIETAKGGVRAASDGSWSVPNFPASYGKIKGTKGADGQQIDVFVGGDVNAPLVFIIDQYDPQTGKFDEHKVMLGFPDLAAAQAVYDAAFSDGSGPARRRATTPVPMNVLKAWMRDGRKRKPFAKLPPAQQPRTVPDDPGPVWVGAASSGPMANAFNPAGRGVPIPAAEQPQAETLPPPPVGAGTPRVLVTQEQGKDEFDAAFDAALDENFGAAAPATPPQSEARGADHAAVAAVEAAVESVGVPASVVDPDDIQAAAEIVAATGADPAEAFQQVMAEQIEETSDAEQRPVPERGEGGAEGGQQEEGERPARSGEAGEDQTDRPDFSAQADPVAEVEPTARGEKGKERGVARATEDASGAKSAEGAKGPRLSIRFADHLREGGEFKNILAARKMARESGFDGDAKAVEEAMELAVVTLAREIVADRTDPKANYRALVDLYLRQPKLGTRTSTSMRDQAFSTPVPLAYLASQLADIAHGTEIYEPTAGNGALLIEADPAKVVANEINPERAENLKAQGFLVGRTDASNREPALPQFDRVIANPPFGAVRQAGESKVFDLSDIQPGYKTKEIDHAIVLRALQRMQDNGRAVLLVGGVGGLHFNPEFGLQQKRRSQEYNSKAKREFYKALQDRYNVVDHFTTSGDLWERQGAGWPVDVIVIEGRGKSSRKLPAVDVPRVLNTWDQLGGLLDELSRGSGQETRRTSGGDSGVGEVRRDGRHGGVGARLAPIGPAPGQSGGLQRGPVQRSSNDDAGQAGRRAASQGSSGRESRGPDRPADSERRPPELTGDFDAAFDTALDETFGVNSEKPELSDKKFDRWVARWLKYAPNRRATYGDSLDKFSPENVAKVRKIYDREIAAEAEAERRSEMNALMESERERQDEADAVAVAEKRAAIDTLVELVRAAFDVKANYSSLSDSVYLDIDGVKVRISDHETRPTYGKLYGFADIDVAVGYRGGESHVWLLDYDNQSIHETADDVIRRIQKRINSNSESSSGGPGKTGASVILDQTFGAQEAPKSSSAPAAPKVTERTTSEVARSAATNAAESADAAMAGLVQLFGGGKTLGSGLSFDDETYAKAKPLFVQAAQKFAAFKDDMAELVRRMVGEMRDKFGLTRDALEKMRPYLRRFMEDVKSGAIRLSSVEQKTVPAAKPASAAKQEQETDKQVAYNPKSSSGGLGTLVPVNMQTSIAESLADLEKRVGKLDTYVANELGYEKDAAGVPYFERDGQVEYPFAAEQIDALALAIDNMKRGKGYIIGDQTGIGKGRVNAGVIRWAIKNGNIPIFTTAKPNLYGDMYRDLIDIGMEEELGRPLRFLMTNSGEEVPLTEDGSLILRTPTAKKHNAELASITPENFRDKYDVLLSTYNQAQTVKGNDTARRGLLARLAPHAVLAFDESHEAGGQGKTKKKSGEIANRSEFAREMIAAAKGVFYSSATYAKRPDVMDLYAATDMAMAVEDPAELGEAIAKGGVPMQQAVAAMLAKAGQYIRRERSFHGVTYDTVPVATDHEQYDGISQALALIQAFSVKMKKAAEDLDSEIKAEAEAIGYDNAVGTPGAESTLFTSLMHNIITQMLLAVKARPVAKMAIEALERGEKPVISLASTMGAMIDQYAEAMGIRSGDVLDADFSVALMRYLDRSRTIIIKKPWSKVPAEHRYLTDEELGPDALAAYNRGKAHIESLALNELPLSPIDRIKQDLADAGYRVGEITGRNVVMDYAGNDPILRNRPGKETSIAGRRQTIAAFNAGDLDVIILNQAGSTGLSLHASEKYKDQRQRHMLIAQAEANIDTHMQMLGRVHRTGQVIVPIYSQLVADIPAEKRPAAVLAKKMASLNANTTASRGGALTAKDVPDFMNEYGDQVAAVIIADNPELIQQLALVNIINERTGRVMVEDAMRKVTGRIPLLPLSEQEELYQRLEADYDALLQQKAAMGENALEAQTLDLKARPIERTEVVKRKENSSSPFAMPVYIEKTSIVRQGKPFRPEEVLNRVVSELAPDEHDALSADQNWAAMLGDLENVNYGEWGRRSAENERVRRASALSEFATFQRERLNDLDPEKPDQIEKERTKLNAIKDRFDAIHQMLRVGARITLKTSTGNFTSVVLRIERTGKTANPLALSSWKATFALASAERQVTLPFSRLYETGKASEDDGSAVEIQPIGWVQTPEQTIRMFTDLQAGTREERFIATGNLLAAYDWLNLRGRIINYTDEQGHLRQGILTAKDFDLREHFNSKAVPIRDPAEVVAWLKNNNSHYIWSQNEVVRLMLEYGRLHISTEAAKRTGGVYYLDKELTGLAGDFWKKGPLMTTDIGNVTDAKMMQVVARFQKLGAVFVDRDQKGPPPTEKVSLPKPDDEIRTRASRLTPRAEQSRAELQARVLSVVERVAGPEAAQRTATPDRITLPAGRDWNLQEGSDVETVGFYSPGRERNNVFPLIAVSLSSPDAIQTAYHEAWHAIEGTLTPEEVTILRNETDRLRAYVSRRLPKMAPEIARAEPEEVWAEAAAFYAAARNGDGDLGGMHIAARRVFEKILRLLAAIRNALNGMGFRTSEDMFRAFSEGELAERRAALPASMRGRWWNPALYPLASIRRRAARPGDVIPPPETVAGAWAASADKPWKERVSDAFDALVLTPSRAIWDRQIDLLRFQKAAEAMSGTIPESLDTYLAASLYPGKVGERMKDAVKQLWEPVYDAMRDRKVGRDELHEYLYARHAPERNARIREIDPANVSGSGMSDDEAAEIMAGIAGSGRQDDFEAVAALIDRVVTHNRRVMLAEGLESEATLNAWAEAYDHYVPLKGFEAGTEDELSIPSPSSGQGFSVRGPESIRALGRFNRADDILANLLDQTQRTIIRGEKNKVAKTFLRFAREHASPFYKIGLLETRRRINPLTGLVETYVVNASPNRDEVFAVKVSGKTHFIEIRHPGLLQALKTLGAEKMNPFMSLMWRLTREYSRFQTAKNPEFVFTNLVRDLQDAGFTITAEMRERYTRRFLANIVNGRALVGAILGTAEKGEGTQYRRWFDEWRQAGGKISHYGLKDIEGLRSEIERELSQRTESTTKRAAMALPRLVNPINGKLVKFLEALSDVTESMTRLAVYISAREIGMTQAQAARMSRNATVDFNRRGVHGSGINALYAFANANIQGNIRLLRTLRKSRLAREMAAGLMLAGMLTTYWNLAVSPPDDEDKTAYEKRKYWERERNIIIYMPGRDNALKIPLGYGLNVFWMIGENIAMRMTGKVSTGEAIGNVLSTGASAFNPLGSEGSWFDWKTWVRAYTPTVGRFMPELGFNRNAFDYPIHPDQMPWTRHLAHAGRHKAMTHPAAVNVAEFINRLTGGNRFEPGFVDLYPDDIEYAWNFATGGLGRFLNNTSGAIRDYVDGVDRPVERMPFIRRFVASDNSPSVQQDAYYKKREEVGAKAQRLRAAIRSRADGTDDGSADEVIERLATETAARPSRNGRGVTIPAERQFFGADKQLKELRQQQDTIRKDQSLSRNERHKQIEEIRLRMREIMNRTRADASQ